MNDITSIVELSSLMIMVDVMAVVDEPRSSSTIRRRRSSSIVATKIKELNKEQEKWKRKKIRIINESLLP
jgi:hypothetical protein